MHKERNKLLERLFREEYKKLFNYALAFGYDEVRAGELVAETFHEAIQCGKKLLLHPKPNAWLQSVMKNKLMQRQRADRRHAARYLPLHEGIPDESMPELFLQLEKEAMQPSLTVADIMNAAQSILSEEELYLLRRIALEKATHPQVSAELGISLSASQKRLERIRHKLAEALRKK